MGNLCGLSTGEALSRWCAAMVSGNALSDFATAPQWAADGMPNFVDTVDPTDQNADSTGCGMAFISWILSRGPGSSALNQVAQTMVAHGDTGTLAQLYGPNAWADFQAAIAALPSGVESDDPFNALGTPVPGPVPTPTPTPGPGTSTTMLARLLLMAIAADLNGDEATMKADVQSVLDAN